MQTITGYFQMAQATEMKRFCRPADLTDFPREHRYICLKFNKSSCADAPPSRQICFANRLPGNGHEKNLSNQRCKINGS